jgi:ectoine hydroxylase-related dioxygenase (phytanoyl-CoA dioxygenase family)
MQTDPRKTIDRIENLQGDLAERYKSSSANTEWTAQNQHDWDTLQRDGYVILESLLLAEQVVSIREGIVPLLNHTGRNTFEGIKTQRLYNPLAKTRMVDDLVDHPRVTALLDRLFMPNYLLSQAQAIHILPGEQAQLLHCDDGFYQVPRPRRALGAATVWAMDAFTSDNGATVVYPGSHLWDDVRRPNPGKDECIKAVMPEGSAVLFLGTTWHGGGANTSQASRLAFTCQYCEPWLRQQDNLLLGVPPATVAKLREPIQRMIGYSILPPFMGMVNGMHPKRLLENI